MSGASPPGLTRFEISVQPKDGSAHHTMLCDVDQVIILAVGDTIGLDTDYGVTTEVHSVQCYPTCDPMVYVRGRTMFPETEEEAREILHAARRFGWRILR